MTLAPRKGAPTKAFRDGGAALWGTTGWNTSQLKDVSLLRWSIAPLPWKATNRTVSFTDGVLIYKATSAPEAAWQLVKYLASREGQLGWSCASYSRSLGARHPRSPCRPQQRRGLVLSSLT